MLVERPSHEAVWLLLLLLLLLLLPASSLIALQRTGALPSTSRSTGPCIWARTCETGGCTSGRSEQHSDANCRSDLGQQAVVTPSRGETRP